MTTAVNNTASTGSTSSTSTKSTSATSATDASDRFLKLLVTQMQNQDPLNPMDNAQVTSQMAQINTVTGIDKLNTTMGTMNSSMTQMQMLQGAGLVGHQVVMEGNKLTMDTDGIGSGGFELTSAAGNVRIDILSSSGASLGTINQDAVATGQHSFTWTPPEGTKTDGITFKVTATSGGKTVSATSLMTDTVDAVSNSNGTLNLELRNSGTTAYSKVKAVG
jgi:flagellar basal-body rod modification protein FlgD